MSDERIVPSFWLSEFLASDTAVRKGLSNAPDIGEMANIRSILAPGMQRVRECLGHPVTISSGYRSAAVNRAVGGSKTSQHTQGLAADFTAPGFGSAKQVAEHLLRHAGTVRYDQLIYEGTWVHISFSPQPRGQVLTARFSGGKAIYSPGVVA